MSQMNRFAKAPILHTSHERKWPHIFTYGRVSPKSAREVSSILSSTSLIVAHNRKHQRKHSALQLAIRRLVEHYRHEVGVESIWSIEIRVCCPEDMGAHEASIWWDAELWYARLMLRCSLSHLMLEWLVCHELCELQDWRQANALYEVAQQLLPGEMTDRLIERWRVGRNQGIEERVYTLLGHRRPYHIMGSETVVESESHQGVDLMVTSH